MAFILVSSLSFFLVVGLIAWQTTRRGIEGSWSLDSPQGIAKNISTRNRRLALIALSLLVVTALVEATVEDFAFFMQDLQTQVFYESFPEWGILQLGRGSISWALYVGVVLGVYGGRVLGSWIGSRGYSILKAISPTKLF